MTTLAAIAFLLGTAAVVRGNAAQTLLPSIVASDDLERAKGGAPKTSWAESSAHPWPAP